MRPAARAGLCGGRNYIGHNYIGHNYIGHNYVGHNYVGHNYVGHNYIGHNYIGHNYIGHNYSARCDRQREQVFAEVGATPPAVSGGVPSASADDAIDSDDAAPPTRPGSANGAAGARVESTTLGDASVMCASCGASSRLRGSVGAWRAHPRLGLLMCDGCVAKYEADGAEWAKDDDGKHDDCQLCAEGKSIGY